MKTNRRDFIKTAGMAGTVVVTGSMASCTRTPEPIIYDIDVDRGNQVFNMCGYVAPKIDVVRMGIIGIGGIGRGVVGRMRRFEGVEIKALCDLYMDRVEVGQNLLAEVGAPPARAYADGSHDLWKKMVESDDLDLIYVCTPRAQHTEQCVFSMMHDKHAATEIPASATVDECWQLVETSERTRKHCSMIENVTYADWELLILNMIRQDFFGEVCHVDASFIANQTETNLRKDLEWRTREFINRDGNLYPCHGLGPACHALDINRGDQLDYMTSTSSNDFNMGAEIERRTREDDYYKQFVGQWKLGNMNTSVLRTVKGKTMMLQYGVSNPRPGSRMHWIIGTKGISKRNPPPNRIALGRSGWYNEEKMKEIWEIYTPPIIKIGRQVAESWGVPYNMNFLKEWRLIDSIRKGLPLDQDVYDAAAWSVIVPLSEWSVANYGSPVKIPDFTRSAYKNNTPWDLQMSHLA